MLWFLEKEHKYFSGLTDLREKTAEKKKTGWAPNFHSVKKLTIKMM
jgi:hypothetical protein